MPLERARGALPQGHTRVAIAARAVLPSGNEGASIETHRRCLAAFSEHGTWVALSETKMRPCSCHGPHVRRRIVLTGGPGAGKTAVLELIRRSFCQHVRVLPESAGIVFGGGFPRSASTESRRSQQRAIFCVQRELELSADVDDVAIVLCDRGTVDGVAYWPGPGDFWSAVGTTAEEQLRRYDMVIHLRTPAAVDGYNHDNPLRIESALEAAAIDERIANAWHGHPRRFFVAASTNFLTKASEALDLLRREIPACCAETAASMLKAPPTQ